MKIAMLSSPVRAASSGEKPRIIISQVLEICTAGTIFIAKSMFTELLICDCTCTLLKADHSSWCLENIN